MKVVWKVVRKTARKTAAELFMEAVELEEREKFLTPQGPTVGRHLEASHEEQEMAAAPPVGSSLAQPGNFGSGLLL